jgi:hypothetical protein
MAGTAAGHDGDFVCFAGCIGTAEDDLVLSVQSQRWVCEGKRVKRSENQVVGVGEEMFGWQTVRFVGKIWRGWSVLCIVDQKSGQFRLADYVVYEIFGLWNPGKKRREDHRFLIRGLGGRV